MTDTLQQTLNALAAQVGPTLRDPLFWTQLLLFALVAGLAWLLARALDRRQWRLPGRRWQTDLSPYYFPLLALFGGRVVREILERREIAFPVFERLGSLFWLYLLYIFAARLAQRFRPESAEGFRRSVLVPLLLLAVLLRLSGAFGPLLSVLNSATILSWGSGDARVTISLGLLLLGPLALLLVVALAQGLRGALIDDVLPQLGMPLSRAFALGTLVSYAVMIVGAVVVLSGLGIPPSTLTVVGSALAVGLGFGLQNTVNNMVSGFLIMFDPLMNVGDTVEVANERGVIRHVGIRNTVIETADGTRVVMPNATLSSSPVLNLTASTRAAKQTLTIAVRNDADPAPLAAALVEIMAAHPNVRERPAPLAQLREMSGGLFTFALTYHVLRNPEAPATHHELALAAVARLRELGATLAPPP